MAIIIHITKLLLQGGTLFFAVRILFWCKISNVELQGDALNKYIHGDYFEFLQYLVRNYDYCKIGHFITVAAKPNIFGVAIQGGSISCPLWYF